MPQDPSLIGVRNAEQILRLEGHGGQDGLCRRSETDEAIKDCLLQVNLDLNGILTALAGLVPVIGGTVLGHVDVRFCKFASASSADQYSVLQDGFPGSARRSVEGRLWPL